jgi:hypothetical protein
VTFSRALWIILVVRPRPRSPDGDRRRWKRIVFWAVVAVAPAAFAVSLVAEVAGAHNTRWAGGLVTIGMLAGFLEALMLAGWWEQSSKARERRRRLRDQVLRRERRAARIADLERALGFGAYDEITAILEIEAMRARREGAPRMERRPRCLTPVRATRGRSSRPSATWVRSRLTPERASAPSSTPASCAGPASRRSRLARSART